jgi:hypothetical protein
VTAPGRNDGTTRLVSGADANRAADRLDERVRLAESRGEHVWIVAAAYNVSEDAARAVLAGQTDGPLLLDAENLASLSVGCYRCEEPATLRLMARRCRGEQ